jgi:hypothetical protein
MRVCMLVTGHWSAVKPPAAGITGIYSCAQCLAVCESRRPDVEAVLNKKQKPRGCQSASELYRQMTAAGCEASADFGG